MTAARCATCNHLSADHGTDRDGRSICYGASCGCYGYVQPTPGRFRDDWDDSALPRVRNIDMPPWIEDVQP